MKYPKFVFFRLFGYEFDLQIDNIKDREIRAELLMEDLKDWSDSLKELEPLEDDEIEYLQDDLVDENAVRVCLPASDFPATPLFSGGVKGKKKASVSAKKKPVSGKKKPVKKTSKK